MQDLLRAFRLRRARVTAIDLCSLLPPVTEVKSAHNLRKNLPNEIFADEIISLNAPFDDFLQITTLAVLHYDIDLEILLVDNSVVVPHNIWVSELPQNVDF